MSVKVKICGITRYEDAKTAVNLGADAVGFIFFPGSPRFVSEDTVADIVSRLPPFVSSVGVFVNETIDKIKETVCRTGINTIQLHGSETPEYCSQFNTAIIKAFSVKADSNLEQLNDYHVSAFLLDTWGPEHGGTGRTFDWRIARSAVRSHRIILAGGLGPSNLEEAINEVQPYAVDLNSGVEISPGIKNPRKLSEAMKIAKGTI